MGVDPVKSGKDKKVANHQYHRARTMSEINSILSQDAETKINLDKKLDLIIQTANSFSFSKQLIDRLSKEALEKPREEFKEPCLLMD